MTKIRRGWIALAAAGALCLTALAVVVPLALAAPANNNNPSTCLTSVNPGNINAQNKAKLVSTLQKAGLTGRQANYLIDNHPELFNPNLLNATPAIGGAIGGGIGGASGTGPVYIVLPQGDPATSPTVTGPNQGPTATLPGVAASPPVASTSTPPSPGGIGIASIANPTGPSAAPALTTADLTAQACAQPSPGASPIPNIGGAINTGSTGTTGTILGNCQPITVITLSQTTASTSQTTSSTSHSGQSQLHAATQGAGGQGYICTGTGGQTTSS